MAKASGGRAQQGRGSPARRQAGAGATPGEAGKDGASPTFGSPASPPAPRGRGAGGVAQAVAAARERIATVVHGHAHAVDALLVALAAGGHVLLDGIPGVGKTTLARTFARVTGLQFHRIQLTPDLMPADITGHNFYNQATRRFELRPGPIMAQVVLADEINRTPPRTQAALLEAMQERQVTIEGTTLQLPRPFLVLATKNPVDLEGVYPLPGAELDRFMLSVLLEYPGRAVEAGMLRGSIRPAADPDPIPGLPETLRRAFEAADVHPDLVNYVLDIVEATRKHEDILLGASPRAARQWLEAARGLAAVRDRDFVTPDDIKALAVPVLRHRVVLRAEAELAGRTPEALVANLLEQIRVPVGPARPA